MTEILQEKKFTCAFCGGTGVEPRSLKSICRACRGKKEVEFTGPAIACSICKGKGRSSIGIGLRCIPCKGVGVVEKSAGDGNVIKVIGERLGEITKRLQGVKKETEKKTKEIEKRLEPVKPFIKEVKKETIWLQNLGNNLKKAWGSLWGK